MTSLAATLLASMHPDARLIVLSLIDGKRNGVDRWSIRAHYRDIIEVLEMSGLMTPGIEDTLILYKGLADESN